MKAVVNEKDVAKVVTRAMAMDADLIDSLPLPKLRKVCLKADDVVYCPPMSAMWDMTKAKAAFVQFKWLPFPPDDAVDAMKTIIKYAGWDSSDVLKKQITILQRLMERWAPVLMPEPEPAEHAL